MRYVTLTLALTATLLLQTVPDTAISADWPEFRGEHNDGISTEKSLPTEWDASQNIAWKTPLKGTGNGSPIVSNGRIFLTTAHDEGKQRVLRCFDQKSGKQIWVQTVDYPQVEETHKTNPYAGSTPAADGEKVVVFHGSAGLWCYDFDGQKLWSADLGAVKHIWGYGSSPILHDGRIYLNVGPGENTFVTAIDLETGEQLWQTEEPGGAHGKSKAGGWVGSWGTPVVAEVEGTEQLLIAMPTRVNAYDLQSGQILWFVEGLANQPRGDVVYTSLSIGDGVAVALGGYQGPAIGFELGGEGDVTEQNRLWRNDKKNPQRIGSGIVRDGYLYLANAGPGVAECIELRTGQQLWKSRLQGGNHWASTVYADGLCYATNQDGTTHVFRADPEKFELLASNKLGEPTNSTPAPADGRIYLRTTGHLWCVGE